MPKMRIFISWSGDQSKALALALSDWLPKVIQNAFTVWMSDEDIEIGEKWNFEITKELQQGGFGVICLTPENQNKAWINFEAGALSKTLPDDIHQGTFTGVYHNRVCPYLLNLRKSDIKGPLAQFQIAIADKDGTYKLVRSLNSALCSLQKNHLSETDLLETFNQWWPILEDKLVAIAMIDPNDAMKRPTDDILEELVERVRDLSINKVEKLSEDRNMFTPGGDAETRSAAMDALFEFCKKHEVDPFQFHLVATEQECFNEEDHGTWWFDFRSLRFRYRLTVSVESTKETQIWVLRPAEK